MKIKRIGFSLMEMMVVLLIISIIAAATAPMVSKRMISTAKGDSPWVWSGVQGSIAYNLGGVNNMTATIGHSFNNSPSHPRLYINSTGGDVPHVTYGHSNHYLNFIYDGENNNLVYTEGQRIGNNDQTGFGIEINNNGTGSSVFGRSASANAGSTAVGLNASATGQNAVSVGSSANAAGNNAIAIGTHRDISIPGHRGFDTEATGAGSVAIGHGAQATQQNAISIGTGTASAAGSIGIGSGGAEHTGGISIGNAAFTAGNRAIVIGSNNERGNIFAAEDAIAIGTDVQAAHADTIAIGRGAEPLGFQSIAIGRDTIAGIDNDNKQAIAIGDHAHANNNSAIAIGPYANVNYGGANDNDAGFNTVCIGGDSHATGSGSIALGAQAMSKGDGSIAIGTRNAGMYEEHASDRWTVATGQNSIAIGSGAQAYGKRGVAIGTWANIPSEKEDCIAIQGTATASNQIVLGGAASTVYIPGRLVVDHDAFLGRCEYASVAVRIHGKGHAGNGDDVGGFRYIETPNWNANDSLIRGARVGEVLLSDKRLKNVGEAFKGGLEEIKKLEVFNFTFKKDPQKTPRVGVIAQDLMKIFPNAVFKGEDGFYKIRMEDMFYALVNAVKELDSKITTNAKRITELEEQNAELVRQSVEQKKMINNLEKRISELEKLAKQGK